MSKQKIHLSIISQEKILETVEVESITAPTTEGEITVLPGHIPLFSRLQPGLLRFLSDGKVETFVVSAGFIEISSDSQATVIVDSVVAAREISVQKAEAAIKAAHETMSRSTNQRELLMAEASLKLALLEIKLAQKTKRAGY